MYQKLKTGVWCQSIDKEMRVIVKVIFLFKTTLKSEASSATLRILQVTLSFSC